MKSKIGIRSFVRNSNADTKTVLVFALTLIVFDFYLKKKIRMPLKNMKIVIFSKTKSKIEKFS